MRFDRKTFFDGYRKAFGSLDQQEVEGLEFLLGQIEADAEWQRIEEISYVFATAKHETAHTFQPIREYRAKPGTRSRTIQDKYWGTGFYGRGFVQLTHKANYQRAGKELGVDLVNGPDKALEPEIAYKVMAAGMRKGWFTRKRLSDYINDSEADYVNARRIVNGLDRANDIAEIARKFERILRASVKEAAAAEEEKKEPQTSVTEPATETNSLPTSPTVEPKKSPTSEVKLDALEKQGASISTKVAAAVAPVGAVATALGLKIGSVELSQMTIIAICAVLAVALIVGAWIYNEGQKRGHARQNLLIEKAASQTENTVRIT